LIEISVDSIAGGLGGWRSVPRRMVVSAARPRRDPSPARTYAATAHP